MTTPVPLASETNNRPGWRSWGLFSPLLGWLLLFVVAPTVILFVYSFYRLDDNSR